MKRLHQCFGLPGLPCRDRVARAEVLDLQEQHQVDDRVEISKLSCCPRPILACSQCSRSWYLVMVPVPICGNPSLSGLDLAPRHPWKPNKLPGLQLPCATGLLAAGEVVVLHLLACHGPECAMQEVTLVLDTAAAAASPQQMPRLERIEWRKQVTPFFGSGKLHSEPPLQKRNKSPSWATTSESTGVMTSAPKRSAKRTTCRKDRRHSLCRRPTLLQFWSTCEVEKS
mmetsp:Transcript_35947/g.77780  ORF Transcript_35947/g.77780 Transcript_35947/m.77780 type:complete len:227 (+) Transcript_35947:1166-1846(+)